MDEKNVQPDLYGGGWGGEAQIKPATIPTALKPRKEC